MSKVVNLVYHPLLEESTPVVGWSKSTVDYCSNNRDKVMSTIRGITRGYRLTKQDLEDMYCEVYLYFNKSADYDISKAYGRSNRLLSLEEYVRICTKCVVQRCLKDIFSYHSHIVRDSVKKSEDGKELSLLDTVADKSYEQMLDKATYDLEKLLSAYECVRYTFAFDIYQIWYIKLRSEQAGKPECYNILLDVLGMDKRQLSRIRTVANRDNIMLSIAKAVSISGVDKALELLKQYVYCTDRIDAAIANF